MNIIIKHIELIERIDQLIRLQATGSPEKLASRLGISRAKVYRLIDTMKELNAPVAYDFACQSFIYTKNVHYRFGFIDSELDHNEIRSINGGSYLAGLGKRFLITKFE
ncbi:HTH domain-containing protein [Aquimarina sediminis]|uniref:HTH domain-containing protein n=1 Tax=Aquimarina sediminis TaxID=2070536 RepID=UPI000FFF16AE|nr:HTH domain-containing protein [Aquimarina sediminis]